MSDMFRITGLRKRYDDFELDGISMALPGGMIMGLVGANGSGKTTTIKLMLNMLRRDAGEVEILGLDAIADERAIKREVGVVMDGSFFYESLRPTQIENILKRMYDTWDSALFDSYLKRFELPRKRSVKEMSRGMKMKLAIASVLARHPRLLLLDEATAGLDPVVRDELLDMLREFVCDERHGVLLSSHITSDLDKIADLITLIDRGRVVLSEGKDELLDRHAIWRGGAAELAAIEPSMIVSARPGQFGSEALVLRGRGIEDDKCQRPTVEDIMLYYTRREQH